MFARPLSARIVPGLVSWIVVLFAPPDTAAHTDGDAPPDHRVYPVPRELNSADDDRSADRLPPLPEGISELRFRDIYRMPVGPAGFEFTERTRELDGQRVRLLGYMVREDAPVPGRLLLAPYPFQLFTHEYGLAEDLPASVVHVVMPAGERSRIVPHTRGLLLLTGVLELGPREEPDGRVSSMRLLLDPRAQVASPRPETSGMVSD